MENGQKKYIGVDVGGTTINIGLIRHDGLVMAKETLKTPSSPNNSELIISCIIDGIRFFLQKLELSIGQIQSIGLGFPGTVDSKNGIVVFAPNIFFYNVDVKSRMKVAFDCPIYLGQDSRAAAWAEYCVGKGRNCNNIAAITIGTGIGCGLILNGILFHGYFNTAGEFGHQLIDVDGPSCNCGRKGCLETYCAGLAIVREGNKIKPGITVKEVYDLAKAGDKRAIAITNQVVKNLGIGMVNLINLLSLEMITISGGISNAPDELLLNPLREFVKEHAYKFVSDKVKIVKSSFGDDAPLIGAALLDETTEF